MSEEELIETLKEFEKNRVEQLKEPSRNLFYAIMKIADERDKYKEVLDKIKELIIECSENCWDLDGKSILELLEEIE
jgi:hypothetical protein